MSGVVVAMNSIAKPSDLPRLSVVCVIDGSFSFAEHWTSLVNYVAPFLQHLAALALNAMGSNPQRTLQDILQSCHLGIIVYGAESNHSAGSPIITRQHFINPQIAIKQLKEENELGIGASYSTGSRGMAILEALTSALELFDTLAASGEKILSRHVIHFASNGPGRALHPSWNRYFYLDNLSWETLPDEIEKRGLQFNTIMTQPIPDLEKFHQKLGLVPAQIKAPPHPEYTILSGRMPQPSASPNSVRQPESSSSTPQRPVTISATASNESISSSNLPSTGPKPQSNISPSHQITIDQLKKGVLQLQLMDEELKQLQKHIILVKQTNPDQDLSQLQRQYAEKRMNIEKFRASMSAQKDILVKLGVLPNGRPGNSSTSNASSSSNPNASNNGISNNNNDKSEEPQTAGAPSSDGQNQTPANSNNNSNVTDNNPTPVQQQSLTGGQQSTPVWSGKLCWQGMDPTSNTRKEMSTLVNANSVVNDPRLRLWPPVLNLSPVKVPPPGFVPLQQVIKRYSTGVAGLTATGPTPEEKKESEQNYEVLRSLLTSKVVIATATLNPNPEGNSLQSLAIVIFPTQSNSTSTGMLLAAILPQPVVVLLGRIASYQLPGAGGVNPNPGSGSPIKLTQQVAATNTSLMQAQGYPTTRPLALTADTALGFIRAQVNQYQMNQMGQTNQTSQTSQTNQTNQTNQTKPPGQS